MKGFRFFLLAVIAITAVTDSNAQEKFSLETVGFGYGESIVASGVDIAFGLSKQNDIALARFGSESGYGMYLKGDLLGVRGLSTGPSLGILNGVPWIGPIVTYEPADWITLTGWTGVSAGNAVLGNLHSQPELAFLQTDIQLRPSQYVQAGFSYLDFGGDLYLPYIQGSVPFGYSVSGLWSVTYDVGAETPMFFIGVSIATPW